ncbi:MAG: hypothetical protein LBD11_06235 [Candidatus Peribacteria bacterium]|jgi:hypothetical protein|nr:hypothetical protein [Candidatus Peribacteria bacterium]
MDTTGISINRIDKYAPYATNVTYTPSTNTNGSVTATLTVNETVTLPAGRNGNATGTIFTKIFSANTGITLTISDLVGNMDTTGITINWIDKTAVTGSIAYSPNTNTNQDVNATITFNKPNVTVTNNGGSTNYTFTGNDSFTFEFVDQYGNT